MPTNDDLSRLIQNNRMPVLFIGAGIPKRYLFKYPDWEGLLKNSFSMFNDDPYYYQQHMDYLTRQGISIFEKYQKLGTIAEEEFNKAFFERKIKIGKDDNPSWVSRGISPYKMYISMYFKKMSLNRNPQLLAEVNEFKKLKNKVSAIITTNYDQFLEKHIFDSDFKVFSQQDELFSPDSYNIAEIYKIHGTCTSAQTIVINEQDYSNFKSSRKLFIAKMLTLFAESPIIFMGYSFTDENIKEIIEDFISCLNKKQIETIDSHFIFISYKKDVQELISIKRSISGQNGNIPFIEIQTDNFLEVFKTLNNITPGISPLKIRETRRLVKTIVDSSVSSGDASSIIVGIDDLNNLEFSNKPLAIAIGYKETIISKAGYSTIPVDVILGDILFDDRKFSSKNICIDRYKSISPQLLLPVFKYVKLCPEYHKNPRLNEYISSKNSIEKIISKSTLKTLKYFPIFTDIDQLKQAISVEPVFNKKAAILLKNINNFNFNEIKEICKTLYNDPSKEISSTNFKRLVLYVDLIENGEEFIEK
ncbi:MAG: SIR2 family protein [Longicatena sp.]|uniref:SIR2 family protein n=1 Tax=Anaerorhabdus sp. TaxID=1872524 RepID=UPI002FCB7BAB